MFSLRMDIHSMKRLSNTARGAAVVLALSSAAIGACQAAPAEPNAENFTRAIDHYLAERGRLCLAKYDWPIYITDREQAAHTRDAVQMPVLEKLGLVKGTDMQVQGTDNDGTKLSAQGRQYVLTEAGQKYFIHKPVVVATATKQVTHPADLCVATLKLDKVMGWEPPQTRNDETRTSVLYTYKIDPAPWTSDADFRRVFPMVQRIIEGAGTMQLREGVRLQPEGWVAEEFFQR